MPGVANTLAEISAGAYDADPAAGLPAGFTAVNLPGLNMADGLYASGHAQASVSTGVLDGEQVLVVAIRGSDDRHDWTADVTDINREYASLKPLMGAIEDYAAAGGKVVLTGHSLGGAMDQIFMSQHLGDDHYRAVTFGSPGALPEKGVFKVEADARITNYVVSDDPFVFLGQHRGDLASYAVKHLVAGLGLAAELSVLTHMSVGSAFSALKSLGANYVNDGLTVTLQGEGPALTISSLIHADLNEHEPDTYVALTAASSVFEPQLW